MKIISHTLLFLAVSTTNWHALEAQSNIREVVEDESWVLKPSEPTQEDINERWMFEVANRHWSGKGDMTSEEKERLWSIFRNGFGGEKPMHFL